MARFVYVEVAPGVITMLPAWMLDPVACARMEIGAPRATVTALIDLHQLLIERGFRGNFLDDSRIVQEKQNEECPKIGSANTGAADSPAPARHSVRFHPASRNESIRPRESASALGQPLDASRRRDGGGAQQ
jgi:hypothetical protein